MLPAMGVGEELDLDSITPRHNISLSYPPDGPTCIPPQPPDSPTTPTPLLSSQTAFVLALVNSESGMKEGARILSHLEELLQPNQGQVSSLFGREGSLRDGLYFRWDVLDSASEAARSRRLHVVVFGGDGSLVWVIKALQQHAGMRARAEPPLVTVRPLGTGNDMARQLKWIHHKGWVPSPTELVEELETGRPIAMDTWKVEISPPPRGSTAFGAAFASGEGQRLTGSSLWVNYFSIGVDAKVVHEFEGCRATCGQCFCCTSVNKLAYACIGGYNSCTCKPLCGHQDLAQAAYIEIDEGQGLRTLELPDGLESLITLNIGSFSSGLDIWGQGREAGAVLVPSAAAPVRGEGPSSSHPNTPPPRMEVEVAMEGATQGGTGTSNRSAEPCAEEEAGGTSSAVHQGQVPGAIDGAMGIAGSRAPSVSDGFLELVGVQHVSHLGLSHAGCHSCMPLDRVAQAQALKFKVVRPVYMQLDGEAWIQEASEREPTTVTVTRGNSVQMLANVGFVPPSGCCRPGMLG